MCKDNKRILVKVGTEFKIDAKFPENILWAGKLLDEIGKNEKDFIRLNTQCENQITTVRYIKTTSQLEEDGELCLTAHFVITIPDRYLPKELVGKEDGFIIKSEEDLKKIIELLKRNQE